MSVFNSKEEDIHEHNEEETTSGRLRMLEEDSHGHFGHDQFPWVFVIAGTSFSIAFLLNKVLFEHQHHHGDS